MTIREFISSISIPVRAERVDLFLSPKFIYKQAQSIIADFLRKDVNSNLMLYKVVEGWTEISCLNLVEVPLTSCDIGINTCKKLMRSKDRLPAIYSSNKGAMIKQVLSIDFGTDYTNCFTPKAWKNIQNRQDKRGRYCFFLDGYLYIPIPKGKDESSPERVRIEAYFMDKYEVDKYIQISNSCPECKDECKKLLDYEMVLPYYLQDDVKKELVNQILNSVRRVPLDTYPDNSENNKTTPQNS